MAMRRRFAAVQWGNHCSGTVLERRAHHVRQFRHALAQLELECSKGVIRKNLGCRGVALLFCFVSPPFKSLLIHDEVPAQRVWYGMQSISQHQLLYTVSAGYVGAHTIYSTPNLER